MEISFTPSPDVVVILNALLDKFENRAKRTTHHATRNISSRSEAEWTHQSLRSVKITLTGLPLPAYFSQADPEPRLIANDQLTQLEKAGLLTLTWLPGETNHLLQSAALATSNTHHASLCELLNREPASATRARLETLLLADQFRFSKDDWRTRAVHRTLDQLRAGKSPAPFSLTDASWNLDLLAVLSALSTLEAETPCRVFSVRTFNDSKRLDDLKPAVVRLARSANREWRSLSAEDVLRELNLVANPTYIHLAGNWQITTLSGEVLSLGGFAPSVGFPAAQVEAIQSVAIHAESVLLIENLTSFHQQVDRDTSKYAKNNGTRNTPHATLCLMGNPAPAIRRLLSLIPESAPIRLWSDMDYGGFSILSQLRKHIGPRIQPFHMDIPTFEKYAHLSRPLTQTDIRNLKHLCARPELADVRQIIEHLIHRGLKLEQEALQV
ncbi:MAG: Wadjet anti-phage system protein JetD domain-containing protein [Chloroflexota bacterium]